MSRGCWWPFRPHWWTLVWETETHPTHGYVTGQRLIGRRCAKCGKEERL